MDAGVVMLVVVSAALHPIWNLLLKDNPRPETVFLTVLSMTVTLGAIHVLVVGHDFGAVLNAWPLILISGVSVALHGFMLVLALERGDLSVYYPVGRSAPIGVVAIGFVFLGQSFEPMLLIGIALVVGGAFALQHRAGARLLSDPLTLTYAVLAMLASAVYSVVDARAVVHMPPGIVFFWQSLVALPLYLTLLAVRRRRSGKRLTHGLVADWKNRASQQLAAGSLAYISYLLILWAYEHGGDVAAVTSVRQASIPLSVIGGALLLRERDLGRRLLFAGVLTVGILVVVNVG